MRLPSLNPFWMCSYSFTCVLFLYSLQLSGLYGSFGFVALLLVVFILTFIIIGYLFSLQYKVWNAVNERVYRGETLVRFNICMVVIGFFIDCLPTFQIPLINILRGDIYSYNEFGLKTFHVFYMGYISAFAVVSFENYLKIKRKDSLLGFLLPILVILLMVNRGALLLILFPMVFVYFGQRQLKKGLNIRFKIISCVFLILGITLFGFLGDKRMISSGYTNEKAILDIGQADPIFNYIPTGFFWVYLYASSPMANLIEQERTDNINKGGGVEFIEGAILPDFISKYTSPNLTEVFAFNKITPELTVATGFGRSFVILGYLGFVFLACWMVFLIITFSWFNRYRYINSACAILSSITVLMIFDNMFIFSSCIMQLTLLTLFSRCRIGRYSLI